MNKLNFLKPDLNNLNTYLYVGSFLIFISLLDVSLNAFFAINVTSFFPQTISFVLPLFLGFIGLHFVRIEFTGIKNKHTKSLRKVLYKGYGGTYGLDLVSQCFYSLN